MAGDAAIQPWTRGRQVPGVAQGGIQGGKHAAQVVAGAARRAAGAAVPLPGPRGRGGHRAAARASPTSAWLGPFGRQGGFLAWALWLGIHIVYLIGFANRIVVSVRWAWSFLTRGRSTRLITGAPLIPPIEPIAATRRPDRVLAGSVPALFPGLCRLARGPAQGFRAQADA